MVPKKRPATRSTPTPPSEVPRLSGSGEVQDLRAQVTALVWVVQRQEEQIGKLRELVSQPAATTTVTVTAPESQEPPATSPHITSATEGANVTAVPVMTRPVPASTPPTASSSSAPVPDLAAVKAKRERALAALTTFKRFNPPTFDREEVDPWVVETWIALMETLFEDIYTLEQDKINLATHCFEKSTRIRWRGVKKNRSPDLPPVTRGSGRPGQGGVFRTRTSAEIFRVVHSFKLQTFVEVLNRALWVEQGNAIAREECDRTRGAREAAEPFGVLFVAGIIDQQAVDGETGGVIACPVQVGDWIMSANLLVLRQLKGFDLILGMDWLLKYYATIDCESKVLTFREPGQEEFTYRGCKSSLFAMTMTTSRAKKLINSGCVAYLATVVKTFREIPVLEDIPMVREFSNVFPAELPGMPSDQKIEFVIDLVPGTAPISKARIEWHRPN
uniref:Uncharacterized protein n=1 Tax=Ananas comosus var. bracteatus TaxID=296719 RepID=A0A6V7NSW6_ANACO|nr:unnamed protein product [Ananas comosus var. bracteatus]